MILLWLTSPLISKMMMSFAGTQDACRRAGDRVARIASGLGGWLGLDAGSDETSQEAREDQPDSEDVNAAIWV